MEKTLHSELATVISKRLTEIRKKAKLSQRQLAERLGREHSFVANCELGERRVDLAEFYWICHACGASAPKESAELMKAFAKLKK